MRKGVSGEVKKCPLTITRARREEYKRGWNEIKRKVKAVKEKGEVEWRVSCKLPKFFERRQENKVGNKRGRGSCKDSG